MGMRLEGKLLLTLLLTVNFFACGSGPGPRVVLVGRGGKEFLVQVEIADTPEQRNMGLQYRRELGANEGMLFLFPLERVQTFWMKNTPISLDLIFIGSRRRIVGIIHQAVPFSMASLSVSAPSQFVLEVKGGLARNHRIEVGDAVRFEGISWGDGGS